jgi:hypothetical protein
MNVVMDARVEKRRKPPRNARPLRRAWDPEWERPPQRADATFARGGLCSARPLCRAWGRSGNVRRRGRALHLHQVKGCRKAWRRGGLISTGLTGKDALCVFPPNAILNLVFCIPLRLAFYTDNAFYQVRQQHWSWRAGWKSLPCSDIVLCAWWSCRIIFMGLPNALLRIINWVL